MSLSERSLRLSVQKGPCWLPSPQSLHQFLSQFGQLEGQVEYDTDRGQGNVVFCSSSVADGLAWRSFCMAEQEGEMVTVFLWRDYRSSSPPLEPVPGLVLLETPWMPRGWAKLNFLNNFFEQFCQVEGIVLLGNKGKIKRAVVAFPCTKVASALQGQSYKLGGHSIMLKEVSKATLEEESPTE